MQLGLCALVVFLSLADLADYISSTRTPKGKWHRQIGTGVSQGCAKGCDLCSDFNGCLKCSPKLFILLERNDIRQTGICLPSCPLGYFDVRNPDMNKCIKCKIDKIDKSFSRSFCTKCKSGFSLHKGRCYATCPGGFSVANGTMECSSPALCEMSEWSLWGACSKKRQLCGFRWGQEERSRKVLQAPSGDVPRCPATTELRRCSVRRNPCPEGDGDAAAFGLCPVGQKTWSSPTSDEEKPCSAIPSG
ncbi:R-spondin-1 [Vipera latastei]